MRIRANRLLLGVAWLSVAAAMAGFFLPWVMLDLTNRKLTDLVGQPGTEASLQKLAGQLTKKVGRVIVHIHRGDETISGELPDLSQIPTRLSGAEIPTLAHREDAHLVLALSEMWTGKRQLGVKSFLVYLLPGVALLSGLLLTLARRRRLVCGLIGLVCFTIAAGGFWKLLTTDTKTLLVAITIGRGLWLSLWAYVGLGFASLMLGLMHRPRTSA
ncbi:MAG: hypothetical protein HYZ89_02565 [Candidatus Omnitrophica bacterium]|nr:hypothetical protein [Candidatus Omnitrophota bacterium]